MPLLILVTLPYLLSILIVASYFVFNKNKKQIKINDYIETQNRITVTKRKFYQLSSICKKTNTLRLYSNTEKNVGVISMCFFLKNLYFYKENKQATFSLINSLFVLLQISLLTFYLFIFLSDKLNINFLKDILEDMKKQDGSYDKLTGGIIFIVYLNIFIACLMWVYGSNLYAYMYEEIIRYY
ncbi:MAG: hypothetical protein E7Y34_00580, partial [Mycoplasma sp.]|nr:hypothetical protein [Mycoplasma sp.]